MDFISTWIVLNRLKLIVCSQVCGVCDVFCVGIFRDDLSAEKWSSCGLQRCFEYVCEGQVVAERDSARKSQEK